MKVFFRADSSSYMGAGHVMRCLTLAEGLQAQGANCHFIMRDLPGNLNQLVKARGFDTCLLPFSQQGYQQANYSDEYAFWLRVDWQQDAKETLEQMGGSCDLLVVDHYGLDACWESVCHESAKKLLVIDDLANRKHDCDFLLDHNYYADAGRRYQQWVPSGCIQFCGPSYALISQKVMAASIYRESHYELPDQQQLHCLVFMGGCDAGGYSEQVVSTLLQANNKLAVTLVVGNSNPQRGELAKQFDSKRVEVLVQPEDYYQRLAMTDFVVGAGGVSTLERFCIGVPAFVFQVADNQQEICLNLDRSGGAIFLGCAGETTATKLLLNSLEKITIEHLKKMSDSGKSLVDGLGADRVVRGVYAG